MEPRVIVTKQKKRGTLRHRHILNERNYFKFLLNYTTEKRPTMCSKLCKNPLNMKSQSNDKKHFDEKIGEPPAAQDYIKHFSSIFATQVKDKYKDANDS